MASFAGFGTLRLLTGTNRGFISWAAWAAFGVLLALKVPDLALSDAD
jgi:hypothetical protein